VAPLLLNHLPRESFQELRKTNVFWKQQLDLAYETHPSQETLEASNIRTAFRSVARINKFMEQMESHPGNPFVGRRLTISYIPILPVQHLRDYYGRVAQLVGRFGEYVHMLQLGYPENLAQLEIEESLSAILQHTPNLRGLKINDRARTDDDDRLRDANPNIFPRLVHLKSLTVLTKSQPLIRSLVEQLCDPQKM